MKEMINKKYKTYSSYEDSGVDWFPEMPTNWNSAKVKYLFTERVQKGFPNEPLLAATQSQGVIRKEDYKTNTVTAQKDFHLLKLVKVSDFVISLRSFQGGIEICYHQGIISPAYTVMAPSKVIDENFYKYLLKSKYFINGLTTFVTGIREGQNIDYSKFRRSLLPVPPKEEQTSIADFLDKKTDEIKEFIRLKEKTIELLKERKTAIINQVATKGLDPNVEMKDSGIEWLGEIPKHWEVTKTKYLFRITGGFAFSSSDFKDQGVQLLKIANLYKNTLSLDRQPTFLDESYLRKYQPWIVKQGDILLSLTGTLGKRDYGFAILIDSPDLFFLNQRVAKVDTTSKVSNGYALFLLRSEMFLDQLYRKPAGTKQANLSNDNIKDCYVSLPPKREWKEIIDFVKRVTTEIDKSISQAEKEIALIKEYQQSLISEAVTGKIDVRDS